MLFSSQISIYLILKLRKPLCILIRYKNSLYSLFINIQIYTEVFCLNQFIVAVKLQLANVLRDSVICKQTVQDEWYDMYFSSYVDVCIIAVQKVRHDS